MTRPTILITRPESDAASFAKDLHKLGCDSILAPSLVIHHRPNARLEINEALQKKVQGVIVTSKHAVQAFAEYVHRRDISIIAVGTATATCAYRLGFTDVHTGPGTVQELLDYIRQTAKPEAGVLIHAAGENLTADAAVLLAENGLNTQKVVVYQAQPAKIFTSEAQDALNKNSIWGVTFFSKRSAEIFVKLLDAHGLSHVSSHIHAFCLSENIAKSLDYSWAYVHVAPQATTRGMLSVIKQHLP